ncbi:MAG: hypothetical protein JW797_19395 [Bradymonadales bacterium]|nr:hypothetical protein [Bradymonadales bacterium]
MLSNHDTVSISAQAAHLFTIPDGEFNRRHKRSGEPGAAVRYQLERVYDFVSSEAIILCDSRGQKLKGVGDRQLCTLLSRSVPAIYSGNTDRLSYQLKVMDIVRPDISCAQISLLPLPIPHPEKKLFVASVSDSEFNQAGVLHATGGIRRILGVPASKNIRTSRRISSADRLAFDLSRAMNLGYHDFFESALAQELKIPRRFFGPSRKDYHKALDIMLDRIDQRLEREGLACDRPDLRERLFNRGFISYEGYRNFLYQLPIRVVASRRRVATLHVQMAVYDKHFEIPVPPRTTLEFTTG